MAIPKRPTVGQRANLTRNLNLQPATKKDIMQVERQLAAIDKKIDKAQREIVRALKRAIRDHS
jgi:hypothetical protein